MQVYKRIRATRDIDLMVMVSSDEIPELIESMEKAEFKFDRKRGVIKINGFELLRFFFTDEKTNFEVFVDLVTAKTEFQRQILNRKTKKDFLGIEVNTASLEDIVLLKLLADRPIDTLDAQCLIEENIKDIDKNYLRNWAKRLGIIGKLKNLTKKEEREDWKKFKVM